ncbi:MAG: hypothetical protein L0215_26005 [Gemmataceae bacterium]|nr:hypothetical protein [Gemmataceae bacterium]
MIASVDTTKSGHWSDSNHVHPFSLVYVYYERPYSEWVHEGVNFTLAREQHHGRSVTRVAVTNPKNPGNTIILFFGRDGRLIERQIIFQLPSEPKPFVCEIHELSDYETFPNPNGEPIWFPRRAVYHYNMGVHPNGTLVEYLTETIHIKDIKFNVEIPDGVFELPIPSDARVWDGVTGLGWLEPGNRPEMIFPEEAHRKRWLTIGIVVGLGLAVTIAIAWYRRGRRAAA